MAKYKLSDVAPIQQGSVQSSEKYWLLNLDMVESNTGRVLDYLYVSEDKIGSSTITFDTGNVLYSKLRPYLNKVVLPEQSGYATSEMLPMRPNQEIITREYLTYFLRSPRFVNYVNEKVTGAKMPRANIADLKAVEVECPPIAEQKRISALFDKTINLIGLRKQQLQQLEELVKLRFAEIFGNTVLNPFGWKKEALGDVCDVRDGTHDSPQFYDTGFPLVTSKNVTGGKIDLTNCSLISETDYNKINKRSKVDIGDILMPMIGTVGKPVIVDIEPNFAIKNVALIKFDPASKVLNTYIHALLQSDYFDDIVLSKVRGGTQKFIALGDIRKLEILVPSMKSQEQFSAFVTQTNQLKFVVQKSIDETQLLFDSLMQKYFS